MSVHVWNYWKHQDELSVPLSFSLFHESVSLLLKYKVSYGLRTISRVTREIRRIIQETRGRRSMIEAAIASSTYGNPNDWPAHLVAWSFRAMGYPRTSRVVWFADESRILSPIRCFRLCSKPCPRMRTERLSHFCRGQRTFFLHRLSLSCSVSWLGSENVTSVPSNLCKAF